MDKTSSLGHHHWRVIVIIFSVAKATLQPPMHVRLFVRSSVCPSLNPPNSLKSINLPYHYLHHHQLVISLSVLKQNCWKHPTFNYHLHLFIERLLRLFGLFSRGKHFYFVKKFLTFIVKILAVEKSKVN